MKSVIPVALLVVSVTAGPIAAQTPRARPAAASDDSVRVALAAELLRMLQMDSVMNTAAEAMMVQQMEANPAMMPFRDILENWVRRYLTWEHMGSQIARLYADSFTSTELRAAIAFYQTPSGAKFARLQPMLTKRGAEIGAAVGAQHSAELEALIRARADSLAAASGPP